MPLRVTPAIPASQIVSVVPSVLSAGGTALDLIGLILTTNTRPPIGQVMSFVDETDVSNFFGATAQETSLATIYFNGPDHATALPGSLLITQYPLTAVSAYLRGGVVSGLSLAALQALNSTLTVTIDSVVKSSVVNLSAATSFSNAAEIIADALAIKGVPAASVTGSIGGTFTASSAALVLTVSAVLTGSLQPSDVVSGALGGTALPGGCTIVNQLTGTVGGTGTYTLSAPAGVMGSTTVTSLSTVLNVTGVTSGTIGIADQISGTGITAGTYVVSQISGTAGGVGLYNISVAHTVASEGISTFVPAVQYDSVSGAFVILSGTTGVGSTITFGSGAMATSLLLTQATGATLSQGAAATAPTTFMEGLINITQDWVSFMTTWEPSDADKEAFATWNNGKKNRYVYEMWSTNVVDTQSGGASPVPAFVNAGNLSGIVMTYEDPAIDTVGGELAAFGMGWTASLDFTRRNGRQTQAFKAQTGLAAQVFTGSAAGNLIGNGLNFHGDYTTPNDQFRFLYPGSISGPFKWKDSYVNQVWLNAQLQLAAMVGLTNVNSVPYNLAGAALIESWFQDPINEAVNFGAIVAGVELSAAQIVEVNQAAGKRIDNILTNQGYYLQVLPAIAQVRAARTSPPCTLWYMDGGAVQKINLASIEVQ